MQLNDPKYHSARSHPWQVVSAAVDEDLDDVVRRARSLLRGAGTATAAAGDREVMIVPVGRPLPPSHLGRVENS